jgi:hypothetical protein
VAKYTSDDIKVEFDNSGGSLVDISDYVDNNFALDATAEIVESTGMGDAWRERLAALKDGGEVVLTGWYDDTATTGPDALFWAAGVALGATRTLKITWGGSKTSEIETLIAGYKRTASIGIYTRYEVRLQGTGALSEA